MTYPDTIDYYRSLPDNHCSLNELLSSVELFKAVPENWFVVITDITGSTLAVNEGKQQQVNLIATGSIVTVLNITISNTISVPFFFGGDGATFLVPSSCISDVMQALSLYRLYVYKNFGLDLRIGKVLVKDVYQAGGMLLLAKLNRSEPFSIPVLLGNGLAHAESVIKGIQVKVHDFPELAGEPDLTGMQCRWDTIGVPADREEVITLLVVAKDSDRQQAVYKDIFENLDNIYGTPQKRQPITISRLKLRSTFDRNFIHLSNKLTKKLWAVKLQNLMSNIQSYIYFQTKHGKAYIKNLVQMADTLVVDGKINTVISGTANQRNLLLRYLDNAELNGELIYGMHISSASIMSCYVRDMNMGHIHFVDGADGGYTQAAGILKRKLKRLNQAAG